MWRTPLFFMTNVPEPLSAVAGVEESDLRSLDCKNGMRLSESCRKGGIEMQRSCAIKRKGCKGGGGALVGVACIAVEEEACTTSADIL